MNNRLYRPSYLTSGSLCDLNPEHQVKLEYGPAFYWLLGFSSTAPLLLAWIFCFLVALKFLFATRRPLWSVLWTNGISACVSAADGTFGWMDCRWTNYKIVITPSCYWTLMMGILHVTDGEDNFRVTMIPLLYGSQTTRFCWCSVQLGHAQFLFFRAFNFVSCEPLLN